MYDEVWDYKLWVDGTPRNRNKHVRFHKKGLRHRWFGVLLSLEPGTKTRKPESHTTGQRRKFVAVMHLIISSMHVNTVDCSWVLMQDKKR